MSVEREWPPRPPVEPLVGVMVSAPPGWAVERFILTGRAFDKVSNLSGERAEYPVSLADGRSYSHRVDAGRSSWVGPVLS